MFSLVTFLAQCLKIGAVIFVKMSNVTVLISLGLRTYVMHIEGQLVRRALPTSTSRTLNLEVFGVVSRSRHLADIRIELWVVTRSVPTL